MMKILEQPMLALPYIDEAQWPILICLLGNFCLLKAGQPVGLRHGGKSAALLSHLGLHHGHSSTREALVQMLWPAHDIALANQSLHSVVYSLHKLMGDAIGGAAPVLYSEGSYHLNAAAGVGVDVECFDALVKAGDRQVRTGDLPTALHTYRSAVEIYRGDLCMDADVPALIERERLRARYLTLLAYLADYHYSVCEYTAALEYAWRLLVRDPCREDAHRLVMQCYVRQGERAEALHQYRVCVETLHAEFDVAPETATTRLFEQIRLNPGSV